MSIKQNVDGIGIAKHHRFIAKGKLNVDKTHYYDNGILSTGFDCSYCSNTLLHHPEFPFDADKRSSKILCLHYKFDSLSSLWALVK